MATKIRRRKSALLIGIGEYETLLALHNPENDIIAMSSALVDIGFTVTVAKHAKCAEMRKILENFQSSIKSDDLVLFYFAGHGVQWRVSCHIDEIKLAKLDIHFFRLLFKDSNYLLPKDVPNVVDIDLKKDAINAQEYLYSLGERQPSSTIFLLDCCRTTFVSNSTSTTNANNQRGLTSDDFKPMNMAGSLIAFACASGTLANDGQEKGNGLFTKCLLKHIKTPNEDIEMILRDVRREVMAESSQTQIPFLNDGLLERNVCLFGDSRYKVQNFVEISDKDLKISETIGDGAFGIVYRATWVTNDYTVAVKRLRITSLTERPMLAFFKELSILNKLHSPYIVGFYGACTEQGKYALIMEHMSLGSLYKCLHEDQLELTWPERLTLALHAAKGISYLHRLEKPIIHGDIKSLNLLLERVYEGYVLKVCDFGIASTRNETRRQTSYQASCAFTIPWSAPEILDMATHTEMSDAYSLGIVYWELTACRIPYEGQAEDNIRAFVRAGNRLQIPANTPFKFSDIIESCWTHKPEDRPNTSKIIQMIEQWIEVPKTKLISESKKASVNSGPPPKSNFVDKPKSSPVQKASVVEKLKLDASAPLSGRKSTNIKHNAILLHKQNLIDMRWSQHGVTVAGNFDRGDKSIQLQMPEGLFVNDDETMFIADFANHRIIKWKVGDKRGEVIVGVCSEGTKYDQLKWPTDVLFDKTTNSLIVCDYGNRRVIQLSLQTGTNQVEILIENIACRGLAMDGHNCLYVSDFQNNKVIWFQRGDQRRTVVAGGHGKGDRLNQLNGPTYLFVDKQESLYISDKGNQRVVKWNKSATEGIIVAGGQGEGTKSTQLSDPRGLFIDVSDNLYVADSMNHRVIRYRPGVREGVDIVGGHGKGGEANQFNGVGGLSLDRQNNLFVVDHYNNRVQKFSLE